MDFYRNEFSEQIPWSLGNLSMLIHLMLCSNHLQDLIPSSLGILENLLEVYLSENNLSGSIPPKLIGLSSLSIVLDLSHNDLIGSIPSEFRNLKNLANLLFGEIPSSISKYTSMEHLYLQDNFFERPLPSTLNSSRGI